MKTIQIRGVTLGTGRPKVIVPLCDTVPAEVLASAHEIAQSRADLVEWRVDAIENAGSLPVLLELLPRIRTILGEKPLLATCRTRAEGGAGAVDAAGYAALCRALCDSGCIDLIDLEYSAGEDTVRALAGYAKSKGVVSVGSSHDFGKTPSIGEMVDRLHTLQLWGCDIAKLAVMPHSHSDAACLLQATAQMADRYPETPIITMSMGPLGAMTRLCGGAFGSCATFAAAGKASAPGQPGLDSAIAALNAMEDALG